MTWIDEKIPLARNQHKITSQASGDYNCIAWAAGVQTEWWSHEIPYKWPVTRSPLAKSLVKVFAGLGYKMDRRGDTSLQPGIDKVAIYAKGEMWTHAARQLPNGKWTSKLGRDEDIEHENPECLCGDTYGTIHCIMRKAINEARRKKGRKPSGARRQ
ncbi:MAG: hypothetical protein ABSB74_17095 [Tepidisphaeraceae bacterium]